MNDPQIHTIFTGKAHTVNVRQDKRPPRRSGVILSQPLPANTSVGNRPKHHGSEKRKTATISARAPFAIKARVTAMAKAQGLSESAVVTALVKKALQVESDMQYGALLEPVIRDQIHRDMQAFSNRVAHLTVKTQHSAEESRILLIKILSLLLDTDREALNHLIAEAEKEARTNVIRTMEELGFI